MDPLMDDFQARPSKRHRRRWALLVALLALALPGSAGAAQWLGSFNASYQAARPGDTIVVPGGTLGTQVIAYRNLTGCDQNNPATLITISVPSAITINGNLEVHGNCVYVKGVATGTIADWRNRTFTVNVTGYTSIEGDSQSQFPHNVRIEGVNTGNFGTYSSDGVVARDIDVGPRMVVPPCSFPENRIASNGATGGVIPRNVLWERIAIHDMNRSQAAADQNCHYGGLQFWASENVTLQNMVFERNVVYHVDVGEGGFGPTNGKIINSSFSCPADNSWVGDRCDGQRAVQFSTPANFASTFTLSGNVASNGTDGLYGCYSEPCSFAGMTVSGNTNLAESVVAPPLGGGPPPPPKPACSDNADNDGDGKIDYPADPGCVSVADTDEKDTVPTCPGEGGGLTLTKLSETASTVTFGWQPVANAIGYRFTATASPGKYSHTWDGQRNSVKFAKGSACYFVGALLAGPTGGTAG